ncbi:MAG: IclR family transcriptional regulator [Terriglobales bacterium]|jgi:DNA-binding IclR family transcriptional regulator
MKLPKESDDKYVVEAVFKALDVLEVFRDGEELQLSEISKRVSLNKSRAFRLLYTLCERGYVERAPDGHRYRLGLKLFEHASNLRRDVKQVAQPYMRQAQLRFNETVNLAVLHNGEVLYIDLLESSRPFRMSAMVGSRMPISNTSLGKAMIAYASEHELDTVFDTLTPNELRKLRAEMEIVRRRGYATDPEENEPGVACIGAPILNEAGVSVGALSISGPSTRIQKQEREIGTTLAGICREISRHMGFSERNAPVPFPNRNAPVRRANP